MFDVINVIKGIKIIAFNFCSFYQIFMFLFALSRGMILLIVIKMMMVRPKTLQF